MHLAYLQYTCTLLLKHMHFTDVVVSSTDASNLYYLRYTCTWQWVHVYRARGSTTPHQVWVLPFGLPWCYVHLRDEETSAVLCCQPTHPLSAGVHTRCRHLPPLTWCWRTHLTQWVTSLRLDVILLQWRNYLAEDGRWQAIQWCRCYVQIYVINTCRLLCTRE